VPIAIVDGRAGLPTAFRLGAELILTKPVAKDQARNTIRAAVGRVKKEESAHAAEPNISHQTDAHQTDALQADALPAPPSQGGQGSAVGMAEQKMADEGALTATAAAGAPQLTSYSDSVPAATFSAPAVAQTVPIPTMSAPATVPEMSAAPAAAAHPVLAESKPSVHHEPSDDPVLAELEKAEAEAAAKTEAKTEAKADAKSEAKTEAKIDTKREPIFSSYSESGSKRGRGESKKDESHQDQKTRGPLIAVLVLLLVCAGFYAAWMYQPGFRSLAQPQIDRVLALVGMARQTHTTAPTPARPAAQTVKVPVPVPASSAGSAQSSELPTTNPSAVATAPSATSGAAAATSPSSGTSASGTPAPGTPASANPASASPASAAPVSATPANGAGSTASSAVTSSAGKSGTTRIDLAKGGENQTGVKQNAARQSSTDSKNNAAAERPSEGELPGEKTAVILSSQGAGKRLMHSVQPTYPAGTRPSEVQGTMVLKAVVDENGNVAAARVIEGNPALATAAINAVKQWRYRPYLRDGKAQPFQTIVLVDFQHP